MRLKIFFSVITLAIIGLSLFTRDITNDIIPKIEVSIVEKSVYTDSFIASGTIEERKKTEINTYFPVIISDIYVENGQYVEKGQVIAKVDKVATIEAITEASSSQSSSDVQGLLRQALASGLINDDTISQYEGLLNNQSTTPVQDIKEEFTAPESGIISSINISEGSIFAPTKPIAVISNSGDLTAKITVSENKISQINIGTKAVISGSGFAGIAYDATVEKISSSAKKTLSGTSSETVVDVTLKILNSDSRLKPGFSTKAELQVSEPREVLTVCYESVIQDDKNNEFVYVYDKGVAKKRKIKTGLELENGYEILSGLKLGEVVVVNPVKLKESAVIVKVKTA